jgi:UDP-N-acetylglucosamine enolpyruvyl transferase
MQVIRKHNVMVDQVKLGLAQKMLDVLARAGVKIVETEHLMAFADKTLAKV